MRPDKCNNEKEENKPDRNQPRRPKEQEGVIVFHMHKRQNHKQTNNDRPDKTAYG